MNFGLLICFMLANSAPSRQRQVVRCDDMIEVDGAPVCILPARRPRPVFQPKRWRNAVCKRISKALAPIGIALQVTLEDTICKIGRMKSGMETLSMVLQERTG